jgi:hypothetical protein
MKLNSSNVSPETARQIRAIKDKEIEAPHPWIEEFENQISTE